jgi:hypothetical protein
MVPVVRIAATLLAAGGETLVEVEAPTWARAVALLDAAHPGATILRLDVLARRAA